MNNVVAAALPGVTIDVKIVLVNETYFGATGGGIITINTKGRASDSITNIVDSEWV